MRSINRRTPVKLEWGVPLHFWHNMHCWLLRKCFCLWIAQGVKADCAEVSVEKRCAVNKCGEWHHCMEIHQTSEAQYFSMLNHGKVTGNDNEKCLMVLCVTHLSYSLAFLVCIKGFVFGWLAWINKLLVDAGTTPFCWENVSYWWSFRRSHEAYSD